MLLSLFHDNWFIIYKFLTLLHNSQHLQNQQLVKQKHKLKHNHWQQKPKQENASTKLKPYTFSYAFHLLNHYSLYFISSKTNFFVSSLCFSIKAYILFCCICFNPIQDGLIWGCSQILYLQKIQRTYKSCNTPLEFCWH